MSIDLRLTIGIIGCILLVIGTLYPEKHTDHPAKDPKNLLFAVGSFGMFLYALLGWLGGGSIFFLILQIFIAVSTVCMLLNVSDRYDTPILAVSGIALAVWSLSLFEGWSTIIFVAGLTILGIGFAMDTGTAKREWALAVGSAVIALFSYLARDWLFVILNILFSLFSFLQLLRMRKPMAGNP